MRSIASYSISFSFLCLSSFGVGVSLGFLVEGIITITIEFLFSRRYPLASGSTPTAKIEQSCRHPHGALAYFCGMEIGLVQGCVLGQFFLKSFLSIIRLVIIEISSQRLIPGITGFSPILFCFTAAGQSFGKGFLRAA